MPSTDSTDIEGLVRRLREWAGWLHTKGRRADLAHEAATAIESLTAKLGEVRAAHEITAADYHRLLLSHGNLMDKSESAEAKLAAAIGEGMGTCQHCGGKKLGAVSTTEKGAAS